MPGNSQYLEWEFEKLKKRADNFVSSEVDPVTRGISLSVGGETYGAERVGISRGLRRKLQTAARTQFRSVMASPPTTSYGTTHTIASPRHWPTVNNSVMSASYCAISGASAAQMNGAAYPNYNYVKFTSVNYGGGALQSNLWRASVIHTGAAIEVSVKGQSGSLLAKVDDQYVSLTPQAIANDGSVSYWYLNFGSVAQRRVEIIGYGNVPFGGFFTAATDTLTPAPLRGPKVVVVGDSFVEGTGATGSAPTGYVQAFADAMGWDDVYLSGVGSTGFLATTGNKLTYRQRIADITSLNPDIVILQGSINDTGYTGDAIGAEATALIAALNAALPYALICVTSPYATGGVSRVTKKAWDQRIALKSAIQSAGGLFLDVLDSGLPAGFAAQTATLANSPASGATSMQTNEPLTVRGTFAFSDGTRFQVESISGSGPYTINTVGSIQTAQSAGETITQVGDCYLTGTGKVGATTGVGNADLNVSSDGSHPTQAGHIDLGVTLASAFIRSVATTF